MASRLILFVLLAAVTLFPGATMVGPRYLNGQLQRPEGHREWMFVGSNLNMGYREGNPEPKDPMFHNIYMQREAFQHFSKTGAFPNGTMMVMEVIRGGTNASINRHGTFEDKFIGIEVALKDEKRFAGKWAYYKFFDDEGKALPTAKEFKKEACWDCHNKHGAVDNVFVQFYPVLREARPKP